MPESTHLSLFSPDRRVEVRFMLGDWFAEGRNQADVPLWQVWFGGRQMLRWSRVGVVPAAANAVDAQGGFVIEKVLRHRVRKSWQPGFGDANTLLDHHNELVVRLREQGGLNRRIDLIFHCSNEGAAVRVRVPRQRGVGRVLPAAGSVLRFPKGTLAWLVDSTGAFFKQAVDERIAVCETPLTINFAHGKLACLRQAGATRDAEKTPYESSWQVLLLGDKPCDLLQNSGLLLNLGGGALPFVCHPVWFIGGPRVPSRGHARPWSDRATLENSAATPAHRAAFDLFCGVGAVRWDETRFLRGAIGEFVMVARRLGTVWQVAGITGAEGRVLTVRLEDVLRDPSDLADRTDLSDRRYALAILRDPLPGETTSEGFVRETFSGVDCLDKPRMELLPQGGFVLRLEPDV